MNRKEFTNSDKCPEYISQRPDHLVNDIKQNLQQNLGNKHDSFNNNILLDQQQRGIITTRNKENLHNISRKILSDHLVNTIKQNFQKNFRKKM